jgi:hypothetical protein
MGCKREQDFWKPVLIIAECKFKAVSFVKLNLIVNLSANVFIILVHTFSVIFLPSVLNLKQPKLRNHSKSVKAIPLQAWTGPDGSRRMRFPDFKTIGT